ncbi:MAG: right-handed parallel beta-helix repeat-containing protein, partial [Bdellovibrionales bacterium]|nr:right-handed parallel beta-helix repeat-containing protein [Bdellovibrionales bacterium]
APHSMMIYADNVTLVTLKSVKINYTGVSTSVYLSGKNFAWLEVAIEASTTNVGAGGLGIVHLDNTMGTMVRNSMIRNSSVSPIISIGLMMNSSRFNMVSNIFAERNQYGFKALNSSYNSLMGLEVSQYGDGTSYGVYLDSSSYNDLFKGQIENTGLLGTGLSIKSLSVHNRFVDYHVKGSSSGVSIVGGSGSPTGNTFTQTTQSSSYIGVILSAGVTGNEFNGLNIANNSTQGLLIQGATANTFYHLDVNSNTMDGIYLSDGIANKFVDLKSYNNGYSGIALYKNTQGSSRNTFIKALAANNGVSGVNCIHSSCSNNLFHQMTVKSNYQSGFKIGGTQNTISQTFVADNKDYGIYFDSWASSNNLAQLLVLGNEVSDINALNTAQDTYALTNVIYSQGSQISFTGTDSGTHTYSQVLSYSGLGNATGVFSISKPFVNETTSLPYRYSEIETDQVWFSVSTSYPWDYFGQSTDPRSNCSLSEACRIYSAAIENNNIFHNTSLNSVSNGLDNVNGDNSSKIAINGGGCTGDMETEAIFQDGLFNPSYLVNATEILDSTGDGDGLCESGENCVFLNHFGLFQGIGVDKSKYCVATNGQKIYQPLLLGGSSSFTIDKTTSGDRDPMVEIFNSGAQGSSEGGFVESIYNLYINNLESNSSSSTSWYVN